MDMLKCFKCICCLVKCSKYLYFAKKVICTVIIVMSLGALAMSFCDKKTVKKLIAKYKAVM